MSNEYLEIIENTDGEYELYLTLSNGETKSEFKSKSLAEIEAFIRLKERGINIL